MHTCSSPGARVIRLTAFHFFLFIFQVSSQMSLVLEVSLNPPPIQGSGLLIHSTVDARRAWECVFLGVSWESPQTPGWRGGGGVSLLFHYPMFFHSTFSKYSLMQQYDFKSRNDLYTNNVQQYSLSPWCNYERRRFSGLRDLQANRKRYSWRCLQNRRTTWNPIQFTYTLPSGSQLRSTSKNLGISQDDYTL